MGILDTQGSGRENAIPREVVTEAAGILFQHDASIHKWSPYTDERWTLITTLDDYSRYLLYSTTQEIPALRLRKAIEEGNSFFKSFQLLAPYKSTNLFRLDN